MLCHINQNFGYPCEHFVYECLDDHYSISGVCHRDQPGEGAHVKFLKLQLYFDGEWLETTGLSKQMVHKYSEILLTKWLENWGPA